MGAAMRIVVTGRGGKSGSWQVRAVQLGGAIGAEVIPYATVETLRAADVVVAVKRLDDVVLSNIRKAGRPWVWDIIDAYPQPASAHWGRDESCAWLHRELKRLQPDAVVWPTSVMRLDGGIGGLVLPHHAWPKYRPVQVRERVEVIGYEGGEQYIKGWRVHLEAACEQYGVTLSVNGDMQRCDIAVALRDGYSYPAMQWKSNCKLANIQALGVPAIISPESGYLEFGSGKEYTVSNSAQLRSVIELLTRSDSYRIRCQLSQEMQRAAPRLEGVAATYQKWLTRIANEPGYGRSSPPPEYV